jgi:hypothetical protein
MAPSIETLGKRMAEFASGIVQVKVDLVIRAPGETPVFLAQLSSEVPKAARRCCRSGVRSERHSEK